MSIPKTNFQLATKILYEIADILNREMGSSTWLDQLIGLYIYKYLSDRVIGKEALKNSNLENMTFEYLYEKRYEEDILEVIDETYRNIEALDDEFSNLFSISYFSHTTYLISKNDNKNLIRKVLELLNELRLHEIYLEQKELPSQLFNLFLEELIEKHNDCVTPHEINMLIGKLLKPQENNRIYDCACGSGTLLLGIFKEVPKGNAYIYGQEINTKHYNYSRMNMIINEVKNYDIRLGDVLNSPRHIVNGKLEKFDIIASVPPFGVNWEVDYNDRFSRFLPNLPPKSKSDFAFILHMLSSLNEDGKMAVVLPHGILFRGGTEGEIRKELIEKNLIDAVIGLPSNLLTYTSIQLCIVIFKKNRENKDILFIDASEKFQKQKKINVLSNDNLIEIVETYEKFEEKEKYSKRVSKEKIIKNDYNLNIPMYVDISEKKEEVNIISIINYIDELNKELKSKEIDIYDKLNKMKLI